jgi:N-acetylneuraminic acid mutarotase
MNKRAFGLRARGFAVQNQRSSTSSSIEKSTFLRASILLASWVCVCATAYAQTNEWVWMGGSSAQGQAGVYGTLGTPAPGNIPGGRAGAASATDSNGNFWLFGGSGYDSAGNNDPLNDLWEFNPSTNEWTWMSGSSTATCWPNGGAYFGARACGQQGVYGNQGVAATGNVPGSREGSVAWIDKSGNFWLFGGNGYDSAGTNGPLNDLWEFNSSTLEWTWMAGQSTFSICGYTGNEMAPIPCPMGGIPSGRDSSANWIDGSGNLWLFGGEGLIFPGFTENPFNDLLQFDAATGDWNKQIGCDNNSIDWGICSESGVYGTLGIPAAANMPGGRYSSLSWTDKSGNLWLFGGNGNDSVGNIGTLNDLWEYSPSTNEWSWMGGSSALNACGKNPNTGQPQYCSVGGTYGTLGAFAAGNIPGSRAGAMRWTDINGNFWLLGGSGYDSADTGGTLNDLWVFSPLSGEWAWMGGRNTLPKNCGSGAGCPEPGVYGTLGTPAAANTPGGRSSSSTWTDKSGHLWLFGGGGYDASGAFGYLNDIWEYSPLVPTAAPPTFSPAAGTYTSAQTVTISDTTSNATIYYTTNGTTPTTSSSVYSGAVAVSSTETIEAIATANGLANSAAASAVYTINLPPTFTFSASPTSLNVNSGAQAAVTLTIAPKNGFDSAVNFACSGLPAGAACSFNPASVTPSGTAAASTQLVISTGAQSAIQQGDSRPFLPTTALAVGLCFFVWKRRRSLQFILLVAICAALGLITACGTGNSGSTGPKPTPVTSIVTVTATSGSIQQTATISLTVN